MNKFSKCIFILFMSFFVVSIDVNAEVKTYTRTEQNLLVPEHVKVDKNNTKAILNTPAVDQSQKIYDFIDLLNAEEEKKIYNKIKDYINNTSLQLVILTSDNVDTRNPLDYMYDFYDYNDFARKGIIFFVYKAEKEYEIYMGTIGEVSNIYTDSRINQTLAYVYKSLEEEKYYECFDNYIKIVDGFYNLENNENAKINEKGEVVKGFPWIEIIILSSALTFIIMMFLIMNDRKKGSVFKVDKLNMNTLTIKKGEDSVVNTDLKQSEKK